MFARGIALVVGFSVLALGCAEPPDETREIIDNLVNAGFPAADIMVVDGLVYVQGDAEVSLAASREMLQPGDGSKEQYRTANVVSASHTKICIDGSSLTGWFSTALDIAIHNYDEQPLRFGMARLPSSGCSFIMVAQMGPGVYSTSGFPSNGNPYHTITIGSGLNTAPIDTLEHVITHEIGHTIGLRHSDYYNTSISCGIGGNEGDAGVGAIHIPGTPTNATVGGSIMNSCPSASPNGEFTDSDKIALRALYTPVQGNWRWCHKCQGLFYGGNPLPVCPAGGAHENVGSGNYHLVHSVDTQFQNNGWHAHYRWCNKCQGLFYGPSPSSKCPAGGAHNPGSGTDYSLQVSSGAFTPNLQPGWRWCNKCQGVFYSGSPSSVCPADLGAHNPSSSVDYSLNFY